MKVFFLFACTAIFVLHSTGSICIAQDSSVPTPKIVYKAEPSYPAEALAVVVAGATIRVFAEVDRGGNASVVEAFGPWVKCMEDDPRLEALRVAAIDAAEKTTFEPLVLDGRTIETTVTLTYEIEPQKHASKPILSPDTKTPGSSIEWGEPISLAKPYYPLRHKYGVKGQVELAIFLTTDGQVKTVIARSGHPLLLGAAARAACDSTYKPSLREGDPIETSRVVKYNFN